MARIRINHLPQPAWAVREHQKHTSGKSKVASLKQLLLLFGFYEVLANV